MARTKTAVETEVKPETKLEAATQIAEEQGKFGRERAYDLFRRDEKGLLVNTNYVFTDEGTVDWKAMIPKKFIAINEDYFIQKNIVVPSSIDGLDDKQLILLLPGTKELARIRGIVDVQKKVIECSNERVVVSTRIFFEPNYETNMKPYAYEEVASATVHNTNSKMHGFLETIASNRSFTRALRNALRIDIVGSDELANFNTASDSTGSESEHWHALVDAAKFFSSEKYPDGFQTFEEFKKTLAKTEGAETWNDWKDIPAPVCFKLIGMLKKSQKST